MAIELGQDHGRDVMSTATGDHRNLDFLEAVCTPYPLLPSEAPADRRGRCRMGFIMASEK